MSDRRRIRELLRTSLSHWNAEGTAKVFQIQPIATTASTLPPSCKPESLLINGVDFASIFINLVDANEAAKAGHAIACFEAQAQVHTFFNRVFSSSEGNWLVPALWVVCRQTRIAAMKADQEAARKGGKNAHTQLQKAVAIMQDSFSKAFNDRMELDANSPYNKEGSKKIAVLGIVNELFQCYFTLNILRLCKNLIKPVVSRKLDEVGTMGNLVTYRYFVGRLSMFEDQHAAAEEHLDFAFQHCHKNAFHNKRCVLQYLVPVKLLRGRLPSEYLLKKYKLHEFEALVQAIRKGDLRTFQEEIVKYQDRFIRQGTYLLMEKCKTVCYRNLFKRMYKVLDKHQISLNDVARVFKWLGMPIDLDEVECILANLIYRGYVRGYLSHAKRILVLSKKDPFPLSAIVAK